MHPTDTDNQPVPQPGPQQDEQEQESGEGYQGRHRAEGSRFVRLRALLAATGLAAATLVVATASPATAATPGCTQSSMFINGQAHVFAPSDDSGSWRCTMRRGTGSWSNDTSWHWGVFQLQEDMNRCYASVIGYPLSTDGDFGGRTQTALIKVQQYLKSNVDSRIAVDGIYGPHTAATMWHSAWAQTPYGTQHFCTRLP